MIASITSTAWRGDVPAEWRATRIKRVADFSPAFSGGKPMPDEECTVVPMEAVSEVGSIATETQQAFSDVTTGLTNFENGDVLFAKITPCMENGKGAHVENLPTRYAFGSTEFHVLRPRHEINARFLYYTTFNPFFRSWAEKNMHGAAGQQRVPTRFLKYTDLALPPLPEQKRIAAYLDASCAAIDRAVETKQKQLETLDALRKSIIQRAVTQGLNAKVKMKDHGVAMYGLAPAAWRKGKLRYEILIANGKFASDKIVDDGAFPIYGGNGVMARSDEWNTEPPFIVIGRVGAYCGNAHFVNEKAWVSDNAMHVTTNHHPQFLAELFTALDFNSQANNTAQPVITGTKIKNTYVLLPPRTEQAEIHKFVCEQRQKFAVLAKNLKNQITTLTAYRKSLIHECVTGKRRISDADVAKVEAHV